MSMTMNGSDRRRVAGGYEEVETLDDPGGAHAVISKRMNHNLYTVAFFRMYDRDGVKERTSFFGPAHFQSLRRMITTAERRISELMAGSPDRR